MTLVSRRRVRQSNKLVMVTTNRRKERTPLVWISEVEMMIVMS